MVCSRVSTHGIMECILRGIHKSLFKIISPNNACMGAAQGPKVPGALGPRGQGSQGPKGPGFPAAQGPKVPGAKSPRGPRAQGPSGPGIQGPRVPRGPGAQGPRVPGSQGPRVLNQTTLTHEGFLVSEYTVVWGPRRYHVETSVFGLNFSITESTPKRVRGVVRRLREPSEL